LHKFGAAVAALAAQFVNERRRLAVPVVILTAPLQFNQVIFSAYKQAAADVGVAVIDLVSLEE
jgi:hypothetical protein